MHPTANLNTARDLMLSQQLRAWGVKNNKVIEAIRKSPKEIFHEEQQKNLAYSDIELPIGHGEVSLAPKIVGRMLEAVNIKERDDILVVGTGSGYITSLCAELGFHVTSIDIHSDFVEKTRSVLSSLRMSNFHLFQSDVFEYVKDKNKIFDVVIFTGSIPAMIPEFIELLGPKGRLFAVVGSEPAMSACLWSKVEEQGAIIKKSLFETVLPSLHNYPVETKFSL